MQKNATIRDVAREASVSTATVSYVFNGKKSISEDTRARVMAAIEKLNYVPNMSARSLSNNDSLMFGVLVPQTEPGSILMFENSFYSEILSSIEYEARVHGYQLLISGTDADESYLNLARERNLDGIIAIGVYPSDFYEQAAQTEIPLVLIDSYPGGYHHHIIRIDDAYGSYLGARHLLENGHGRIAFFCGQLRDNGVMQKRLAGYRQALKEHGAPYDETLVYEGNTDYPSGMKLAAEFMQRSTPASAILAAADTLAIGAMKALYEAGLRVPDDISVVGFDDLEISRYLAPGLSTIHQQISEKGKRAVELLVQNIRQPGLTKREEILPIHLVERGSVKNIKEDVRLDKK